MSGAHGRGRARILEIGNYPPPRCGWSIRTEMLVRELRRTGAECDILNIGPSRRERRAECIDVQSGPDLLRKLLRFARRRYRFHVHANGDSPKGFVIALVALAIGAVFGRRAVLTFHAGASQRFFPRRDLAARAVFGALFGLPRDIVCNSEPVREAIHGYGIDRAKIHVIPAFSRQYLEHARRDALPVEVERFMEASSPALVCYTAYRPEFMLGQFLRVLERTVAAHPRLGVVMIGHLHGSDGFVAEAERLGLRAHLHFAGDLPHEEFLAALGRADLYVRTHLRDGVSSSVLEALALGTPVLAAANESRPPGCATYVGTDAEDFARQLEAMLRLGDRRLESRPEPTDTLSAEIAVLLRPSSGSGTLAHV